MLPLINEQSGGWESVRLQASQSLAHQVLNGFDITLLTMND